MKSSQRLERSVPTGDAAIGRLARSTALNVAGMLSGGVLGLLLVVVVTRSVGALGTGLVFEGIAFLQLAQGVALLGMDVGMTWILPRARIEPAWRPVGWGLVPVVVAASVATVPIMFFIAPLSTVLARSHSDELASILRVMVPFLPAYCAMGVLLAATRGFGTMLPSVLVEKLFLPVIRPALILAVAAAGLGATAIALAWSAPLLAGTAVAAVLLWRVLERLDVANIGYRTDLTPGALWRFALPRAAGNVFQRGTKWLDVLLLGALASVGEAGLYAAASRYIVAFAFPLNAVLLAIAPQISSSLERANSDEARSLFQSAAWWSIAAAWPLYIGLALFAPVTLRAFGSRFDDAATALVILSIAMLFGIATGPVTTVLLMAGKSSWNLGNTAAALGVNVVLNIVLIPPYGILGAAVAWAVTIMIENLLPLLQVRWLLGLQPFSREAFLVGSAAVLSFVPTGVIVRVLLGPTPKGLVTFGVFSSALYLFMLWRFRDRLRWAALRDALLRRPRVRSGSPRTSGDTEAAVAVARRSEGRT